MTQPPGWGTPPQQPGGWPAQPGPSRPGPGGQWGPPPPPPPPQQQPWPAPAPVPPKKGGAGKWIVGAVALVAVIALTIVLTLTWSKNSGDRSGDGASGTTASAMPSDVASANDKGPVGIITDDPSCAPWAPINNTLVDIENNGWAQRDPAALASSWTPETREQYESVAAAMRKAADQVVPLAKLTTHRVMRELYGQFVAYLRAYAEAIPAYTPKADFLARAGSTASLVINFVCRAVSSGAAAARATAVIPPAPPASVAPVGDMSNPTRMFDSSDVICPNLSPTLDVLLQNPSFKVWLNGDAAVAASNWSPEQRSLTDAVVPAMTTTADALEALALKSANPIVQDIIELGVLYRRTFVQALPTYQANDQNIYLAGQYAPGVVSMACKYAAG